MPVALRALAARSRSAKNNQRNMARNACARGINKQKYITP